jgi:hypothetical protein
VLDGLGFGLGPAEWPDCNEVEWDRAVYYLNRNQLTLIARQVLGENLPAHLQARFDGFLQANRVRLARLRSVTGEAIAELQRGGIETVLLKGFARVDEYVPDPDGRMHYDIDLYCPQEAEQAAALLNAIGYAPIAGAESEAAGHLTPLAQPTSWRWRDDFFDLETPVHVELHQVLWVPEVEGFAFSRLADFWARRESSVGFCTLSRHDSLAYRCMHLLRHLLRGDVRAAGVYEIAYFLQQNRFDDAFWSTWQGFYAADLERGQAVCLALAQRWFGCAMHAIAQERVDALPAAVREWMERSAATPVEGFFVPGKHELGLHFALLDSTGAKFRVAMRRLFPTSHTARMWEGRGAYLGRLSSRAFYHAKALAPTLSRILLMRR